MLPEFDENLPLGDEARESLIIMHLDGIAKEASDDRAWMDPYVEDGINLFVWSDVEQPKDGQICIPEIQNSVVSTVETQLRQPPRPVLEPVETGEPGDFYWTGPQEEGLSLGLPPQFVVGALDDPNDIDSYRDPIPLPRSIAEQLKAKAVSPELMPALPPGYIRPEWITELNDRLVADTAQKVFNVLWMRSDVDAFIRQNQYNTGIMGTGWGSYEFDDEDKKYILRYHPFGNVHMDPMASEVSKAAYIGVDNILDADEAKKLFPELAEKIDYHAVENRPPENPWSSSRVGEAFERTYYRKIITLSIWWIRNQLLPMSEDEAVSSGKVEEQEVADAPAFNSEPVAERSIGNGDDDAGEDGPSQAIDAGSDHSGSGNVVVGGDYGGDIRSPESAGQLSNPFRSAYFLTDTGAEVAPGSLGWPKKRGIRQITVIAKKVVADRESEFLDFPIYHNRNVPLPGSHPQGMPEGMRLESLQRGQNRTVNSIVEQADFNAHPLTTMPESVKKNLPKEFGKAKITPGMTVGIPDTLWLKFNGNVEKIHEAPPISPAEFATVPMLREFIQDAGGRPDVMRGNAPSADASGKMVELLQAGNQNMMTFKGYQMAAATRHVAKEMLWSIRWRMKPDDIAKIVSQFRECPHMYELIWDRLRDMEWNIIVDTEAGKGAMQAQRWTQDQAAVEMGIMSLQTFCERHDIDYRVERERKLAHEQWMANQQGALAAAGMLPGRSRSRAVDSSNNNSSPQPEVEPEPTFDLELVDTDALREELKKRCRAGVFIYVPKSLDGETYTDVLDHCGRGWEVKGMIEHARDVIKSRFPGIYGSDETPLGE